MGAAIRLITCAIVLAGCTSLPADPGTTGLVIVFCGLNCPVSTAVTDDGRITDTLPLEDVHLSPEAVAAVRTPEE